MSPTNTITNHQINKEVAKPAARKLLREKTRGLVVEPNKSISAYNLNDSWWAKRIDMPQAIKNAKGYIKDYERTLPETLSPQTQNQMWKRAKQLKDEFVIGMLSRDELHPVKGFMDNGTMKYVVDEEKMRMGRSAEREMAWSKKNESKISEFKNLMRHLNPDDSGSGDIERYRPQRKA